MVRGLTSHRRRRGYVAGAVALGAALALSACGGPSFTYMKNDADKTYLRLPKEWTVLPTTEAKANGNLPGPWQRAFDAAEPADVKHLTESAPAGVLGRLTVFYISAQTADSLSVGDLRAAVSPLDADPVAAADGDQAAADAVREFKTESRKGGLRGSRVVYTVQTEDGGSAVFDQTTLLDPKPYANPLTGTAMFKVYALSLHCSTACYDKAKADIDDVVTSWTVVP